MYRSFILETAWLAIELLLAGCLCPASGESVVPQASPEKKKITVQNSNYDFFFSKYDFYGMHMAFKPSLSQTFVS